MGGAGDALGVPKPGVSPRPLRVGRWGVHHSCVRVGAPPQWRYWVGRDRRTSAMLSLRISGAGQRGSQVSPLRFVFLGALAFWVV